MSVQFGKCNFDGKPVDKRYLDQVGTTLRPYGPDAKGSYSDRIVSILYYAFWTTKESRSEVQPHICATGPVVTFDGRLDNRADLIRELGNPLSANSADAAIVATAYERWGSDCFAKVIGDWALSAWNPVLRSLVLARDPIGTKHLYYFLDRGQITWSTVLDPLVRLSDRNFELNEEYVAGWLSMFPAAHLTPCVDVHSVPPSCFVLFRPDQRTVNKYWDFDPNMQIRYRADSEYEDHFRTVFATAVGRRLRSDRAVLAELSGGRDSSSIVCMADEIIAGGQAETPRLDTISYYDDSEPNWNERPYFTRVEEKRGRCGYHIDIALQEPERVLEKPRPPGYFPLAPGSNGQTSPRVGACLITNGNRVVLSGIGGDEITGGVPTALPELADLLLRGRLRNFVHQLMAWSLQKRQPWIHLFGNVVRKTFPFWMGGTPAKTQLAPWLQPEFVTRHRAALTGYVVRTKLFGPLPSFQDNIAALDTLRRQLGCAALPFSPTFEKRYPFLDRSLLEFIFAIPREQLVRPTQRRSLMRRALLGIVPSEILDRRSKAFAVRSPMVSISNDAPRGADTTQQMLSAMLGIVNPKCLLGALQKVRGGEDVLIVALTRTLLLETWLQDLRMLGNINIHPIFKTAAQTQAFVDAGVS